MSSQRRDSDRTLLRGMAPDPVRTALEAALADARTGSNPAADRILRVDPKDRSQVLGWLSNVHDSKLDKDVRDTVFLSHGVPPAAWEPAQRDRDAFLRARRDHLIRVEAEHMTRQGVVPPMDPTPQAAAIDVE